VIQHAIILGNHIQGLGVARICHSIGLEVHLYNNSSICLTRFSNTCTDFTRFKDHEDLKNQLLGLTFDPKTAILLPTNDKLVGFMADHYELLKAKFVLSIPEPEVTDICYNKIKSYRKAEELGIPHPKSLYPTNLEELESLDITYPVIIKPAVMHKFYHQVGKKVFLCEDKNELISNYKKAIRVISSDEVIVQEFLDGGAANLYSFGSFCDGKKVWGSFVANRIRQKPMNFGIATTFAKTVINPRIDELAQKMLTEIGYFGLSEVEFMYDHKTDDYKFIEINPRTWKWHTITNKLDINLIKMLVDYADQKPISERHNQNSQISWIERITDTYVVTKEILNGNMKLSSYLKSMNMSKEYACFSWRDPLPGFMYLLLLPYLYFKR